jgi:hypothetical protein
MGVHTLDMGGRGSGHDFLRQAIANMEAAGGENPMTFEQLSKQLPTTRVCGDCTLCCTTHAIHEMDKPAGVPCPMLRPRPDTGKIGCGIYGQHPASCEGYVCLWRASNDFVPRDWLPAKVGWVLSWDPFTSPHNVTVHLDPARPNAWRQAHFIRHFKKLAREYNVMVVFGGGDQAVASITPVGNFYEKHSSPELFLGATVGMPAEDMLPGGSTMLLPGAGPNLTGEGVEQ